VISHFLCFVLLLKGDSDYHSCDGSPHDSGVDLIAKVQLLENELAEAMEASNKYKIQLQRWV